MQGYSGLQSMKGGGVTQAGGAQIYSGVGVPGFTKRSQKDLLKTTTSQSVAGVHTLASQAQASLKSNNSNGHQCPVRGSQGPAKRSFGDDLTNRINHSYAMNHATAMGHHILEPIVSAGSTTSVSADAKVQHTKPQSNQAGQSSG